MEESIALADQAAVGASIDEKQRRRQALRYANLFWLFLAGNVLGVLLEGVWSIGVLGHWETHVTMLWGPFNIVYGIGAVFMYIAAVRLEKKSPVINFLVLAAVGSTVEYLVAVFQERVFHSVSWDYSNHPFDLNGKISLPITLMWGALGVLFAKLMLPVLKKVLPLLNRNWLNVACAVLSVLIALDMLASLILLYRWGWYMTGHSQNAVLQAIDRHCTDDFMAKRFVEWTRLLAAGFR